MKSQVFRFMRKTQANSLVGLPTTQQGQGKGKANKDLLNDIKGVETFPQYGSLTQTFTKLTTHHSEYFQNSTMKTLRSIRKIPERSLLMSA
jgi:hypothetical protein